MLKKFREDDLDMLVAKRVHSQSKAYRKGHVFGNKFFTKFVNFFFGNEISDIFSGFRIFSKRFIKSFPLSSNEFEIDVFDELVFINKEFLINFFCICNKGLDTSRLKLFLSLNLFIK